jgi:hypothetical protein
MSADSPDAQRGRAFRPESTAARCPGCGSVVSAEAVTIVDARNTEQRDALLSGRLNAVTCPTCGQPVAFEVPLLYFDVDREEALLYAPGALASGREESERAIGRLTNRVIEALPPEQRKSYLLQPKTFFTARSFMEAMLAAHGVSPEDMARARTDAMFLEELAQLTDQPEIRRRLESAGRADDARLPQMAAAMADAAAARGDSAAAARLEALGRALAEIMGPASITFDDLVEMLLQAPDPDGLSAAVAGIRPVLDYAFFSELTRRAEAAEPEQAARLTRLRTDLLAAVDDHDARMAAEYERASDSLNAILGSADPQAAARRRAPALDGVFLSLLQSTLQDARQRGRTDLVTRLEAVQRWVIEALEARMGPRERLVNRLARAAGAAERREVLSDTTAPLDAQTVAALRQAAADAGELGADDVRRNLEAAASDLETRISTTQEAGR